MPIKVFCISDSCKITTGFGNVARELYQGFFEAGYEVHALGMLDPEPARGNDLPYSFYPTSVFDPMGFGDIQIYIPRVQPDIVFIMVDPGNLTRYVVDLIELNHKIKSDSYRGFKILAYPPVEGFPMSKHHSEGFKHLLANEGRLVFWCKSAVEISARADVFNDDYIYFGNDHAPFRKYDDQTRHKLRRGVNLDTKFIIGSVGVNKRTKGFPQLIYTAVELKRRGVSDVLFYCHTEPNNPTMQGYFLKHMVKAYDVSNMFLWKVDDDVTARGKAWTGVPRTKHNLEELLEKRMPRSPLARMQRWMEYDYITRMNCFDMYLDTSEVEGWGLPQLEAMACGVPTFYPDDKSVRAEIYRGGGVQYDPLPVSLWGTWHTGSRLVNSDPAYLADLVISAKNNPGMMRDLSKMGMEHSEKYKWAVTRQEMNRRVKELYETGS